ncbi:MAG: glycosyltransferase family 2 protein [bacterium]|nr:glycosyltransferase family 2 protein [bacterium]
MPISVVIPAYNAATFLPMTLDSLAQQTRPPAVVYVVDDGSTDDTATIAEARGAKVIRQQQRGPAAARNRGVEAAETEYVAFLDADDWYGPDKLEKSFAMLDQLGATCLATDAWQVLGDRVDRRKNDTRRVPTVLTQELLIGDNPIVCSTVVARREAILEVGGFDEDPVLIATEDYDLWLRLAHDEPIAYLAEPLTFYRAHPDGLSDNARFLRGIERILAKVAAMHPGEAHFAQLIARRRAAARCNVAYDLLQAGQRDEAREVLREANRLAPSWKSYKLWLKSMLMGSRGGTSSQLGGAKAGAGHDAEGRS